MSKKTKLIFFAVLYLLLIPIFAGIYFWKSDEFYHSTIKYENNHINDKKEILRELKKSMIDTYKIANQTESLPDEYFYSLSDIDFFNLEYHNGYFYFDVIANYKGNANDLPPNPINLKFCLSWETKINDEMNEYGVQCTNYNDISKTLKLFFPSRLKEFHGMTDIGYITISKTLEQRLKDFRDSTLGKPNKSLDNFLRLLYLSSVTITTVGYGDIVPISTTTRLLISTEAILGIVLIGLFVNASFLKE
ncbi:Ion channel [Flavobacterium resistens]|uniref:Ion channel n=1 Tax=Flavobacterium resistens TaxID=443612 RepID=A0A521BLW4_9FLAO|nr:potassium channel family protein [Flavobacterium resistens]MRX67502.1 hypothetical protein [Flavobacterium resistens]SMO48089.1 Ion channel [Flavobacterium resistens]